MSRSSKSTNLAALVVVLLLALGVSSVFTGSAYAATRTGGSAPSAAPTSPSQCVRGTVVLKATVKGPHTIIAQGGNAVWSYKIVKPGCAQFVGKIHVNLIRTDLKAWGGPKNGVGRANKPFTVKWNDPNPGSVSIQLPKAQVVAGECLNAFQADVINGAGKIIATTRELIPGAEAGCTKQPVLKPVATAVQKCYNANSAVDITFDNTGSSEALSFELVVNGKVVKTITVGASKTAHLSVAATKGDTIQVNALDRSLLTVKVTKVCAKAVPPTKPTVTPPTVGLAHTGAAGDIASLLIGLGLIFGGFRLIRFARRPVVTT